MGSPPEVAKFVGSLFVHRNPDVLFLRGIRTMFLEGSYSKIRKLVEEAMEARNSKGTYLFLMLELLSDPHLESDEVERVLRLLGPLKENENMLWLRATIIRQFDLAWNDGLELVVHEDGWLGRHGNC